MTATKRTGLFALFGVLAIVVSFGAAALARGAGDDPAFLSPVLNVLFISGLSSLFSALWTPILSKAPARSLTILATVAGIAAAGCFFMMNKVADEPVIFSPWLLGYPLLGLMFAAVAQRQGS